MITNAHRMVADLCVTYANEVYEELAKYNEWYKANPDRHAFIRRHLEDNAMDYIVEARKNLATELTWDETSDKRKDQIHEALTKDAALRGSYDQRASMFPTILPATAAPPLKQ